jgi:hypothetical protein
MDELKKFYRVIASDERNNAGAETCRLEVGRKG